MNRCPECVQGKHQNCTGWALGENDEILVTSSGRHSARPTQIPVCANDCTWPDGQHPGSVLCDADDDFRPKDVPCPFCDPDGFIEYEWSVRSGEHVILWESDEKAVHPDTEIHFHDGQSLTWTATHPERGEERVLFRSIVEKWDES